MKTIYVEIESRQCELCKEFKETTLFRAFGRLCEDCKLVAYNFLLGKIPPK